MVRLQPCARCWSAASWAACDWATVSCRAASRASARWSNAWVALCRVWPICAAAPSSAWPTPCCCATVWALACCHSAASVVAMSFRASRQPFRRCASAAAWAACNWVAEACSDTSRALERWSNAWVTVCRACSSWATCVDWVWVWLCKALVQVSATWRAVPSHWPDSACICASVVARRRSCERWASWARVAMACSTTGRMASPAWRALAPRLSCSEVPTVLASWV